MIQNPQMHCEWNSAEFFQKNFEFVRFVRFVRL